MAARAGHELSINVTRWHATLEVADEPARWTIELNADPSSLEVREGPRGVKPLTDKDRVEIRKNIEAKSSAATPLGFALATCGLSKRTASPLWRARSRWPAAPGRSPGSSPPRTAARSAARSHLTQSDWDIRPYRGLMGALKVRDEVEVAILPSD